jgi:hypothetical protein
MPIPAPEPITTDPVEAKTYPHSWIASLSVNVPSTSKGSLAINLLPCDATTGDIADGKLVERLQTGEFWQMMAEVPEAAAAMHAVFDAVPAIRAWIKTKTENQNS